MQDLEYYKYRHYFDETLNTFAPIYWVLKMFSLHCQFSKKKENLWKLILRIGISAVILLVINSLTLYYKVVYLYQILLKSVKYTDAVQAIYDYIQYVIDLLFVFKYGTDVYYEYIKQYACIDEVLGMTFYKQIKRRIIRVMTVIFCMWLGSSVYDYIVWFFAYGFLPALAYGLAYFYIFIKILTNLDLTIHIMHIESRLCIIGNSIQDCYSAFENISNNIEETITKRNWFYNEDGLSTRGLRVRPVKTKLGLNWKDVKGLSRSYLLLTEQVMFINNMFGIRILLNILSFLIDIVRFTNLIVRLLFSIQHLRYHGGYLPASALVWRALTYVLAIVSIVSHCEQTYRQRERIISLIDQMISDKELDDRLLESFKELRSLVESRTITFHMATFSTLNNSLLVSIASVVVTYTIILLSFN